MSRPVFQEVVDVVTPILVLARGGVVFIKQDNHTIILTDTAVEQLSEVLMRAGATSIRVRQATEPPVPRRSADTPFPADPAYADPLKEQPTP